MIDTKALRQKILDMAIKGKLVPQDPNDEPASVLLEHIRAEKQQLIKEGKIKKDKNDSIIYKGDDNRYYENLPCGWKICGVSDITNLRTGATFDKANVLLSSKNEGIRVLRGGNISTYKIDFRVDDIFIPTAIVNPSIYVQQYDIITPAVTSLENIGKMARVHTKPTSNYTVGGFVYLLTPLFYNNTFSKFLLYQFTSTWFIRQLQAIAKKSGAAFYNINKTKFNELPVFIPPLAEQARIVNRVEELFTQIDAIEQNQADIDTLYDEFRKRTLTLAIQGKLVPQDSNDEPASVLLERIRAEKKAKLGKKYVDSYIYKSDDNCYYEKVGTNEPARLDNLPFDIPDSWCWTRLENAVIINPRNDLPDNLEVSFVEMKAIADGYNNHFSAATRPWKEVKSGFTHFQNGDVGFAKITPCFQNRKSVVFSSLQNEYGAGTTELHFLRPIRRTILPKYLLCFVKSPYLIEHGKQKFSGTAGQQRFGTDEVKKTLFPLPPLVEQDRIVKRAEIILEKLKDED